LDYFSITAGKRKGRYQETKEKCTQANPAAAVGKPENILLQVDANGPNWSDVHVAKALHCHGKTIRNVRQRFVEQGLEAVLVRQKHAKPSRQRLLTWRFAPRNRIFLSPLTSRVWSHYNSYPYA
jgi:hypothetical protein